MSDTNTETPHRIARNDANSAMLHMTPAFDEFDGACDPAFDNDLDDVERQFADCRLALASDMN